MIAALEILRPRQWAKNAFVFAPYVFALRFNDPATLRNAAIATLCFIAVSGAVYIFNDFMDLATDQLHPMKKFRPLAAGKISGKRAGALMVALLLAGYFLVSFLPKSCFVIILIYLVFNIAYSKGLKNYAIIDVLIIAMGFVFRVLMGGYAIGAEVSAWIILATLLLALFLAFGKRYAEINGEGASSESARRSFNSYNKELLGKLITVSCAAALICYGIYAADAAARTGRQEFVYTTIFVVFGLFRYMQIIFVNGSGEEPEKILFRDRPLAINLVLWLIFSVFILIY